jgi:hypothetical protein
MDAYKDADIREGEGLRAYERQDLDSGRRWMVTWSEAKLLFIASTGTV